MSGQDSVGTTSKGRKAMNRVQAVGHRTLTVPVVLAMAAFALGACGSDETPDSTAMAGDLPAETGEPAAAAELGGETYTFDRSTCDLEDSIDDDILARASGTIPDGRRASIEVERREVGDQWHERVTVYFGSLMEGDQWHAVAHGQPGGQWFTGTAGGEVRDGPLIVIRGNEVTAEGSFSHETRDETREGSVRILCGG